MVRAAPDTIYSADGVGINALDLDGALARAVVRADRVVCLRLVCGIRHPNVGGVFAVAQALSGLGLSLIHI